MKTINKLILPLIVLTLSSCSTTNIDVIGSYNYDSSSSYKELTENYDFTSKDITSFSIDYVAGYITITQEGDEFKMYEKNLNDKIFFPCYYKVENDSIDIKYVKSGTLNNDMKYLQKEIYINIPSSFKSIDMDLVSTSITASNIELEEFNVDTVGGDCYIEKMKFNNIFFDSVGANLKIGEITNTTSSSIKMNTTGGELEVGIKEELGYKVDMDTVSGKFSSEFSEKEYGNKLLSIDFDSVSGSCTIKKVN